MNENIFVSGGDLVINYSLKIGGVLAPIGSIPFSLRYYNPNDESNFVEASFDGTNYKNITPEGDHYVIGIKDVNFEVGRMFCWERIQVPSSYFADGKRTDSSRYDVGEIVKETTNLDNINTQVNFLQGVWFNFPNQYVDVLPAVGTNGVFYFVPNGNATNIYIYSDAEFHLVGSTSISLADFYTKAEINSLLDVALNERLKGVKVDGVELTPDANKIVVIPVMAGASASTNGEAGLVPKPLSGQQGAFLRGDSTYGLPNADVVASASYIGGEPPQLNGMTCSVDGNNVEILLEYSYVAREAFSDAVDIVSVMRNGLGLAEGKDFSIEEGTELTRKKITLIDYPLNTTDDVILVRYKTSIGVYGSVFQETIDNAIQVTNDANTAAQRAEDAAIDAENIENTKANHGYESNPKTLKEVDDDLAQLAGDVRNELYERTINLFDKTKVTDGVYLIGTGRTSANPDYWTSDYIQIESGITYIINKTFTFIEQFDNNKQFVIGSYIGAPYQKTFTALQNGFVRISESYGAATPSTVQLQQGVISTVFQEYYIPKYAPLAEFNKVKDAIDVSFSGTYGELDISGTLNSYYGDELIGTMSTINSRANKSGYLNNFIVRVNSSGVLKIVIGLLDQNMRVINQRSEYIDVVAGANTLNLANRRIFIEEGEQVFLLSADLVSKFAWGENTTTNSRELIFGDINGILGKYPSTYGGKLALSWDIMEIDSVFAENDKLESIQNAVKSQSSIISNVGVVIDRVSGAKYKQVVVGGQLQLIPMQYKKVLIIGNSLTKHSILTSIGWYGDNWAMAASTRENSWDYLLQRILAQKEPTATVTTVGILSWEQNPMSVNLSTLLDSYLVAGVDCVIFKAGENGTYTSDYLNGVNRLVEYIITKLPSADILMTSMFWATNDKELAISQSSAKYGLTYISTQSTGLNRCNMGDYSKGSDGLLHPITNAGVAYHMNDVGFYLWTNILAESLGYEKLNELHQITVIDNGAIGYICPPQWVKGGIVSVHTTATTVSATDATSTALTVTDHLDGVFTFTMPDTPVTVTIG